MLSLLNYRYISMLTKGANDSDGLTTGCVTHNPDFIYHNFVKNPRLFFLIKHLLINCQIDINFVLNI